MGTKKNLTALGVRIKILLDYFGFTQSQFAESLEITDGYLSDIMHEHEFGERRAKDGGKTFWDGVRQEFPEYYDYLSSIEKVPPWEKKDLYSIKDRDSTEAGRSDIDKHRVVEIIEPAYIQMVKDILKYAHKDISSILKANIELLHKMIKDKQRLN